MADLPPAGEVPEWVHLLPASSEGLRTFDGRGPYRVLDPAAVIAASFQSDPRNASGLLIDENHALEIAAKQGGQSPSRGRIVAMEARADGIWGKVEWTPTGHALLAERAYRGISPVIIHDAQFVILQIKNAALVNYPNLRGQVALNQETEMTFLEQLAHKRGLPATASEADILAAIPDRAGEVALQAQMAEIGTVLGVQGDAAAVLTAARAAKAAAGTGTAVPALQAEITTLTTRLNAMTEAQARARAEAYVDGEVKAGRAGVKPLRDHYVAMHMADAARVEKELDALPILGVSGTLVTPPGDKSGTVALQAEQLQVAAQLGLTPAQFADLVKKEQN